MPELPDWLRGVALLGKYGTDYVPLAVDASGQLYILLTGSPEVTIPDTVNVAQTDATRQVQGTDGATFRTLAVDSLGQLIAILKGASGVNVGVDADGLLGALIRGELSSDELGAELVTYGGFETYTGTQDDGITDAFTGWDLAGQGSGDVADATATAHSGFNALKLIFGNNGVNATRTVTVEPEESYHFIFYTTGNGTVGGQYRVYDFTNAQYLVSTTQTGVLGTTWRRIDAEFTAPALCVSVGLMLMSPATAGFARFDDVSLKKVLTQAGASMPMGVDGNGQIIATLRGQDGHYADIDEDGFLTTVMKGADTNGNPITVATDTSGQIIAILKGASGVNLGVDENGYISAMLKALYGSTPTGVACDEGGRIKFLLCDGQDMWGEFLEMGNAELAARICGPVHSFQRRGQVIYWSTFKNGLPPWTSTVAEGGVVAEYASDFMQDGKSIRMTTAGNDTDSARIDLDIALPVTGEGIGFGFWVHYAGIPESFKAWFKYHDGTNYHECYVYFLTSNGKIYIYRSDEALVEVGTWSTSAGAQKVWHYCKLSANLDTGKYISLWWDNQEIDLSATSYHQDTSTERYLEIMFHVTGEAVLNSDVRFDCPVVTVRES